MTAIPVGPADLGQDAKPDPLGRRKNGLLGAQVSRIDGPIKVRGAVRFAAEVTMPGMVYASLVYSTIPKGRIATLDTSAAQQAPRP